MLRAFATLRPVVPTGARWVAVILLRPLPTRAPRYVVLPPLPPLFVPAAAAAPADAAAVPAAAAAAPGACCTACCLRLLLAVCVVGGMMLAVCAWVCDPFPEGARMLVAAL